MRLIDVDLDAVKENTALLKKRAGCSDFMAVVKADGYGAGAVDIASAAIAGGATWLGVARINEGSKLRGAGFENPILVLSEPEPIKENITWMVYGDLTPTVYTSEFIEEFANRSSMGARVHLKINTGMNRVGCELSEIDGLITLIKTSGLILEGVLTHLSSANTSVTTTFKQINKFDAAMDNINLWYDYEVMSHVFNTAGVLYFHSDRSYDMVRCGLGLLGLVGQEFGLKQAINLESRLASVRWLSAGSGVGYGGAYKMRQDGYIGVIPVGYADGVPRSLAGVGWVVIGMLKFPIVAVTMDMIMVDLGRYVQPVGSPVELLGTCIPVSDWKRWLEPVGYNEYEIACNLGRRRT